MNKENLIRIWHDEIRPVLIGYAIFIAIILAFWLFFKIIGVLNMGEGDYFAYTGRLV